jgi:protein-S-isoprenylcysteine O-methyltransferase Ste14
MGREKEWIKSKIQGGEGGTVGRRKGGGELRKGMLLWQNYSMAMPRWIYRFRTYMVCPPLFFALIWNHNEIEADWFIWPLGIGLFLIGMALRIWAQQHLHHRLRVHKQLTTTGPYQYVRNSLYIGNIMICVAVTIVSELLWFIPVTLFWCIGIYSFVIRYEEARLLSKYGDAYSGYLLEVPRWVPKKMCFRNVQLMNKYLGEAISVELPCLLILLPYVIKEIAL